VIAASVAAFVGLGFAVLIVAVLAVVILWLYGSFWITSTVIIVGGHILRLIYYSSDTSIIRHFMAYSIL
jgi:hypothetical protein